VRGLDGEVEHLHKLVDELPEDATAEPFALISDLAHPDDGRLSEDELTALDGRVLMPGSPKRPGGRSLPRWGSIFAASG
jgi:hypothetical protein